MKKLNNKLLVLMLVSLLSVPMIAMAQDSTDSSSEPVVTTSVNTLLTLKGKIEGYKVILSWEKIALDTNILGYKIIVTNQDGNQKILSVGNDKNTIENWDAKPGLNKYQIFVIADAGEVAKSQVLELKMGPNGGYDLGTSTTGSGNTEQKPPVKPNMEPKPPVNQNGDKKPDVNPELKTKLDALKISLEESLKYLREHITKDNLEEIKAKAESLREEYTKKFEELGAPEEAKNKLRERFEIFFKFQIENRYEKQSTEQPQKPEQAKKTEPVKGQKPTTQQNYKQLYAKKLESKLANLSAEQIKAVITKVDALIEKYTNNTELTQEKKEKFIMQLNAIKQVLQDKLDELENGINLDEIFTN